MSLLSHKHLQDEQAAYNWVEAHVWPEGPVCPHCGSVERIAKMQGKATRIGLYKCYACRKQFRVLSARSSRGARFPPYLWLQAFYLLCSPARRALRPISFTASWSVTLKTAWFI